MNHKQLETLRANRDAWRTVYRNALNRGDDKAAGDALGKVQVYNRLLDRLEIVSLYQR